MKINLSKTRIENKMLELILEDYAENAKMFMAIKGYTIRRFYDAFVNHEILNFSYEYFVKLFNNDPSTSLNSRIKLFKVVLPIVSQWELELVKSRTDRRGTMLELGDALKKSTEKNYNDFTLDQVLQHNLENYNEKSRYLRKTPVIDVSTKGELEKIYQDALDALEGSSI